MTTGPMCRDFSDRVVELGFAVRAGGVGYLTSDSATTPKAKLGLEHRKCEAYGPWYPDIKLFSSNLTKGFIARRGIGDRSETKWVTRSGMLEKWMKRCCKWQVISIYKLEDSTVL